MSFGFHDSLCRILRNPEYQIFRMAKRSSADIHHARNAVVRAFLELVDVEYLWWLDADVVFGSETLRALLAAEKPITSALY